MRAFKFNQFNPVE